MEGALTPPPVTPLPLLNPLFVRQRVSPRARVEPRVSLSLSLSLLHLRFHPPPDYKLKSVQLKQSNIESTHSSNLVWYQPPEQDQPVFLEIPNVYHMDLESNAIHFKSGEFKKAISSLSEGWYHSRPEKCVFST